MDPRSRVLSGSVNGIQLSNQPLPVFPNQNLVGGRFDSSIFVDHNSRDYRCSQPDPSLNNVASVSIENHEEDSPEDCDFSDAVLRYINQMLMEEDIEDKTYMLQESLELQAAEKPFYDVLGKKYPPSPEQNFSYIGRNEEIPDSDTFRNSHNFINSGSDVNNYLIDNSWIQDPGKYFMPELRTHLLSSISQSCYSSSNSVNTSVDGLVDSPSSILQIPDWNNESQSIWQFRRGIEEASKFLPSEHELFVNFEVNQLLSQQPKGGSSEMTVKLEKNDGEDCSPNGSRGRKNLNREDTDLEEERSSKLAAVFLESPLRSEMFDMVLLCARGKPHPMAARREAFKNATKKNVQENGQSKRSNGGKGRGKKQSGKKEVVDLRTLLINCAQAVAADDRRNANELLKQIRQHSSPFGDGNQRLAQCFADGLEARLAGTGSQIYKGLISKRTSAADILKAYYLYLACCPFRKITHFTSNRTIRNLAKNSTRLHIIDFGILYGFQWPTFLQWLSMRPGGPPKLRITGIEFPQPGFRPAEGVEETGRRLVEYAKEFKVPFEYHAIAKRWECVQLEDLKIDKDEFLVVNCLYRGKNLLDETVAVDSARNIFLNLVRKINPDVFIHGIVNGAYNAPFFVTRFREALFHFSAMFDLLETLVPREDHERMLIEHEIFGREALNVIACEGWERVERPETYKQWQVRNLRAGFVQIPFDREIVQGATQRVRSYYHKDFVIHEDSQWLLQGWKGRIIYALSAWTPA
ncbi:scarecrow-like protein 9 [Mangifera indica]|uniref:scarecrow-like protein 9 n=1 Tax=Mangifera indica TaxID=29780 RepID=UPI001CFBEEAA|nr:scarecrow-like protein 9 [Mangifera indica]